MGTLQRVLSWRSTQELEDRHPFQATEEGERLSDLDHRSSRIPATPVPSGNMTPSPSISSNILSHSRGRSDQYVVHDTVGLTSSPRTHTHSHPATPSGSSARNKAVSVNEEGDALDTGQTTSAIDDPASSRTSRDPSPHSTRSEIPHQAPITSSSKSQRISKIRRLRHRPTSRVLQSTPVASRRRIEWKKFKPTLILENSGSVARDHLASERTFLAYVRTSLALASTGVALVQLFTIADLTSQTTGTPLTDANRRIQRFARPLGVAFILLGLIVLSIVYVAAYRYFLVQRSLPEKNFPVARFSIAFISFVLGAMIVVIFGALLQGKA